jgi:hypothetical protein
MKRSTKSIQKTLKFAKVSELSSEAVAQTTTPKPISSLIHNPESQDLNELKIWAWNVNGLRAVIKSGQLQQFLDEAKPNILCLNETKIDSTTL